MDLISKPSMPDNAEDSVKCPVCGAMINISGVMGQITCPVCGKNIDGDEARVLGISNEGY